GGIDGDFRDEHVFFPGIVPGDGVSLFVLGADGGVHLPAQRGGELQRLRVRIPFRIDGHQAERHLFPGPDQAVIARYADIDGGGVDDGGGGGGQRLVVRIRDLGGNLHFPAGGELRLRDVHLHGGLSFRGKDGFSLNAGGARIRAVLIIIPAAVAEVVVPVTPVGRAMVAEKEVPETLRIGVLRGDAGVV